MSDRKISDTTKKLMEAKKLIEKGWCKNSLARNSCGKGVLADSVQAVAFCMVGALSRVHLAHMKKVRDQVNKHCRGMGIETFNDRRITTHADVLQVFDAVIQEAIMEDNLET